MLDEFCLVASRKMVCREACTEGSETAIPIATGTGTDEQKRYMRRLRNRLRYCIWKAPKAFGGKKPERKRKNLIRLGIPNGQAYAWRRTRMGGWAVAQSPILGTTITLERLIRRGYESMLSYYEKSISRS